MAIRANRPANPEPPPASRLRGPREPQQPFDMKSFNAKLASFLDLPYPDASETFADILKATESPVTETDVDEDFPIAA